MDIVIFNDVTQNDIIESLEAEGKKYEGLYCDMDNKDERKYVKDKAAEINGMLKRLDRARIDKSKEYKSQVELEAKSIRGRLEEANKPFTLLIDEYKAKRAEILAAKKAEEDAKEAFIQLQADHELALLLNREFDRNYDDMIAVRKAEQERLAKEAVELSRKLDAEMKAKRESDITHISGVRTMAKVAFMDCCDMTEDQAKKVVMMISGDHIPNVSINY